MALLEWLSSDIWAFWK
jgi:hypothetical protein